MDLSPRLSRRALLGAAALTPPLIAQPAAPRPNIVIFLADDLGWNDVSYQGGQTPTPHIDRLVSDGLRLDRFYACPVCSPTRSSIMTGRSPMRYGIIYDVIRPWENYGVPAGEHFLPQTLRALGYQTAAIGKWHMGHTNVAHTANARGFDHFYGFFNGAIDYFTHERNGGIDWQRNGKSVREEGYTTDLLAAEAVRLIEGRDRSRPFFLYAAFNAPHLPYQAPAALIEEHAGTPGGRTKQIYAAMLDSLDGAIGRVLDALDGAGMHDDTLVLFLSDNGGVGAGDNRPLRAGKATTFEGGLRVPAGIRWPGRIPAGSRSAQVMTVLDVFPTLAAAAGGKPMGSLPLDGRNLLDDLRSGQIRPREDLFFAIGQDWNTYYSVHHAEWKLVIHIPTQNAAAVHHLFEIEKDPNEEHDLAERHPDVIKDLAARIEAWKKLHPPVDIGRSSVPHPGWIAPRDWAAAIAG